MPITISYGSPALVGAASFAVGREKGRLKAGAQAARMAQGMLDRRERREERSQERSDRLGILGAQMAQRERLAGGTRRRVGQDGVVSQQGQPGWVSNRYDDPVRFPDGDPQAQNRYLEHVGKGVYRRRTHRKGSKGYVDPNAPAPLTPEQQAEQAKLENEERIRLQERKWDLDDAERDRLWELEDEERKRKQEQGKQGPPSTMFPSQTGGGGGDYGTDALGRKLEPGPNGGPAGIWVGNDRVGTPDDPIIRLNTSPPRYMKSSEYEHRYRGGPAPSAEEPPLTPRDSTGPWGRNDDAYGLIMGGAMGASEGLRGGTPAERLSGLGSALGGEPYYSPTQKRELKKALNDRSRLSSQPLDPAQMQQADEEFINRLTTLDQPTETPNALLPEPIENVVGRSIMNAGSYQDLPWTTDGDRNVLLPRGFTPPKSEWEKQSEARTQKLDYIKSRPEGVSAKQAAKEYDEVFGGHEGFKEAQGGVFQSQPMNKADAGVIANNLKAQGYENVSVSPSSDGRAIVQGTPPTPEEPEATPSQKLTLAEFRNHDEKDPDESTNDYLARTRDAYKQYERKLHAWEQAQMPGRHSFGDVKAQQNVAPALQQDASVGASAAQANQEADESFGPSPGAPNAESATVLKNADYWYSDIAKGMKRSFGMEPKPDWLKNSSEELEQLKKKDISKMTDEEIERARYLLRSR